jgi:Cu2+-exporting ATPase
MRESGFCCSGCAYVYRLVHEHGLAGYYRLKDAVTQPADTAVFEPRDYSWLAEAQSEAEAATGAPPSLMLGLQGVSCAGCVWLIERLFQEQPGARDIFVNAQLGTMRIRWVPGRFSAADFARKLQAFGYLVGPDDPQRADPESRGLLVRVGLCAAFALNVMLFALPAYFGMDKSFAYAGLFGVLCLGFATLSLMVGGSYFLGRAWQALRMGVMHIDLPIAIGIIGAYSGSLFGWLTGRPRFIYFDFVSAFIFLMLVGRWAQVAAVERNRRRLLGRQPARPRVRVLADGATREVRPEDLRPGDAFLLPAGRTVPVAARMVSAEALFSLASINGESEPRILRGGQTVPAGAVNVGRKECRVESLETWKESLLARLLEPGERPGWRHAFLEKIVRGYLLGILVLAFAAGVVWWMRTGDVPRTWSVVTAVLVVSCPCAIGLAFPLADEMATAALRRRGVFVRENDLYGKLQAVRRLVFDKTGTLTLEMPALRNIGEIGDLDSDSRSALLSLVRDSAHPVSQCLLESLLASGPVEPLPGEVRETIGLGVQLDAAGHGWSLGRPGWRGGAADPAQGRPEEGPSPADSGAADAELAKDGRVVARFHFEDTVRADVRREVGEWTRRGYGVFILSGDRAEKVEKMADELGLPAGHAVGGRGPAEKARWLAENDGARTLMLGDGANDGLAFDRALCRGTPVIHRGLLEGKADFYYLGRGIAGIRALFEIGAMRRRTQGTILAFSVAYNVLAVGLAMAGRMSPLVAAILMPANSLVTLALVSAGMRRAFR